MSLSKLQLFLLIVFIGTPFAFGRGKEVVDTGGKGGIINLRGAGAASPGLDESLSKIPTAGSETAPSKHSTSSTWSIGEVGRGITNQAVFESPADESPAEEVPEYSEKLVQNIPGLKRIEHTAFYAFVPSPPKRGSQAPAANEGYLHFSFRILGKNYFKRISSGNLAMLSDGEYVVHQEGQLRVSLPVNQKKIREMDTLSSLTHNWKINVGQKEPEALAASSMEDVPEPNFVEQWRHASTLSLKKTVVHHSVPKPATLSALPFYR